MFGARTPILINPGSFLSAEIDTPTITDNVTPFVRAENLTHARYEEALGALAGRSVYAGLSIDC
jgi:hypothetical protein